MFTGTINLGTSGKLTGQIVWTSTTNGAAENSSDITAELQVKKTSSSQNTYGTWSYEFGVGNESKNTTWYGSVGASWVTITTIKTTVKHAPDGNGSCYFYGKITAPTGTSLAGKSVAATSTVQLAYIPRIALLLAAPNFSDTDNPTITYENPAGNDAVVQVGIFDTAGMTCYSGYHTASSTGTSYTFNLTDQERQKLKDAVPNGSDSMYVRFYIKTLINGELVEGSLRYLQRIITVKRAATLTSAPNFNDEDNPTITYNNPGGETVDDVQVCIGNVAGSEIYANYRSISRTETSYTFNLTDQEREALLKSISLGRTSVDVGFFIRTYKDGTNIGQGSIKRVFNVVNATPTISCRVTDLGSVSTSLTNDNSVIIKGFNYISASMTSTLKKGATILNHSITNGDNTVVGSSAVFENTGHESFKFVLTDSYGQVVEETINLTLIPYVDLTCNVKSGIPTADGDLTFKIIGSYFNSKFGDKGVDNVLTVKWRYKESTGAYGKWIDATPTLNGNTYEATVNVTGLDYKKAYTLQAVAYDLIKTSGVVSQEKLVKSTPVYNWGENNFDVNVPLTADKIYSSDITSKNLFDISQVSFHPEWTTADMEYATNTIYVYGYSNECQETLRQLAPELVAGETYILSGKTTAAGGEFIYLGGSQSIWWFNTAHVVTEAELNGGVNFYGEWETPSNIHTISEIQIEKGSIVTKYVPYNKFDNKECILYNSYSGSNGTIRLEQSAAKFRYLEIFYTTLNDNFYNSVKVYKPNGKYVSMYGSYPDGGNMLYLKNGIYVINDNTITPERHNETYFYNNGAATISNTNPIVIMRVVGYK